ncbi:hypothetical protein LCGC14_2579310 [marine sediment metagenome]|uniref:Uncharacterized protein n=1 Tax=marine sediment metagenome TaxID=412755 RepID=A0A0F9AF75_9ZZZZ
MVRMKGPQLIRGVVTAEDYLAWYLKSMAEGGGGHAWISTMPIAARVNHARWTTSCAWCPNAPLTDPEWGVAYCPECGASYPKGMVIFPDNWQEIEAILLVRTTPENMNWREPETVADLRAENAANMEG